MTPESTPPSDVELLASVWTTHGDMAPLKGLSEISPWDLEDRVRAAAEAGFTGFGLLHQDFVIYEERIGFDAVKAILDPHGVRHIEVEMLGDWWSADPDRRAASDAARAALLRAVPPLGATHIKCGGPLEGEDVPPEQLAEAFAALCDDAARVGARIALEPMPFTTIRTPADGLELVQAAGRSNGGMIIDIWHVARAGLPMSAVAAIPGERIVAVELNDAPAEPVPGEELIVETIDSRLLPGEGDLDVPGFIRALGEAGFAGPYGVEILSAAHRARPLEEAARVAFDATVAQFDRVRGASSRAEHAVGPHNGENMR